MEDFEVESSCYESVSRGSILLTSEGNGNIVIFYCIRVRVVQYHDPLRSVTPFANRYGSGILDMSGSSKAWRPPKFESIVNAPSTWLGNEVLTQEISRKLIRLVCQTRNFLAPYRGHWKKQGLDGENEMVTFVDENSSDSDDESGPFFCREEGCTRSLQRFSSLQKHLDYGSHKYALERENL